jgi:DNA-binding NtrC family response regulator
MAHSSCEALSSAAMDTTWILAFGQDRTLVRLRSEVLRMAGYQVDETFTLIDASESAKSDRIDALVICHTVANEERKKLIGAVRQTRRLMPIICICSYPYDTVPSSCVFVENSPITLLDSVQKAIRMYKSPKPSSIQLAG